MENKIIHQTWKTSDLSPILRQLTDTWKSNHSDWEYRLWTDADIDILLKSKYPEIYEMMIDCYPSIKKWDVARLVIVYEFGGLYVDIDTVSFKNVNDLIDNECVLFKESPNGERDIICNSIFYAKKKSRFIKMVLSSLKQFNNIKDDNPNIEVLKTTGPLFLTDCYKKYLPLYNNQITVKDHTHFENEDKFKRKDMAVSGLVDKSVGYGVHFGFGSWIVENERNFRFKYYESIKDSNIIIN